MPEVPLDISSAAPTVTARDLAVDTISTALKPNHTSPSPAESTNHPLSSPDPKQNHYFIYRPGEAGRIAPARISEKVPIASTDTCLVILPPRPVPVYKHRHQEADIRLRVPNGHTHNNVACDHPFVC
ncbi:hypothetical protein VTK26DRAFT_7940 [Humicola hyalothermophila]